MKRILAILAVVAAFGATSCKKDYTCKCNTPTGEVPYEYEKVKKADAEEACDKQDAAFAAYGGCTLE